VVVAATRETAISAYKVWRSPAAGELIDDDVPPCWRENRLFFATPEALRDLDPSHLDGPSVAGLLLLDLQFLVHKARSFDPRSLRGRRKKAGAQIGDWATTPKTYRVQHDRPQFVADFRARCTRDGWSPPLIIFAGQPAKSLNTDPALSPYCLEAFWFVDGETFGCWDGSDE
jgi:hypothetical protein